MRYKRTLEQRLYEAWRFSTGVTLSAADVQKLITLDDAIKTRICNAIAAQHGFDEPMLAATSLWSAQGSIADFLAECERSEKGGACDGQA